MARFVPVTSPLPSSAGTVTLPLYLESVEAPGAPYHWTIKSRAASKRSARGRLAMYSILYIIGAIVVIIVVLKVLGLY